MSLQLGFFYRMDAMCFRRLQSVRQNFDQQYLSQKIINFVPLIEVNESDYENYNSVKNQIKHYCCLLDQMKIISKVKFDSYQVLNKSEVDLIGKYDLDQIKDIVIDLKMLLESKMTNKMKDFSETFVEPNLKLIHFFNEEQLDEILTKISSDNFLNFDIELKNLGYVELNANKQVEKIYQEFSELRVADKIFSESLKKDRPAQGDYH